MKKISSFQDLEKLRNEILAKRDPKKPCVAICVSAGCLSLGAKKIVEAFREELEKRGLKDKVELRETGCLGFCEKGPRIVVYPEEDCYFQVQPEDVPEII